MLQLYLQGLASSTCLLPLCRHCWWSRLHHWTDAWKVFGRRKRELNTLLSLLSSLKSELGGSRGAVAVVGSLQVFPTHFHEKHVNFPLRSVFTLWVVRLLESLSVDLVRGLSASQGQLLLGLDKNYSYQHQSNTTTQLWPPGILLRPLPYHGLLKLWPRHWLWLWSHVSLETWLGSWEQRKIHKIPGTFPPW